jgi:hypothetical protein
MEVCRHVAPAPTPTATGVVRCHLRDTGEPLPWSLDHGSVISDEAISIDEEDHEVVDA